MRKTSIFICVTAFVLIAISSSYSNSKNIQDRKGDVKSDKQISEEKLKLKKEKMETLGQLLSDAKNTKPEVASYVLFQLLESGVIDDNDKKIEILEDLFNLSSFTQYQVRRKDVYGDSDTSSGLLDYAFSLNLDKLSIQCRSAKEAITIDKKKARDFFKRIYLPELSPLSCEDSMVHDVSIYYDTVIEVVNRAFSKEEIERREHVYLIEDVLSSITSVLEIGPAIKLLTSLKISQTDLKISQTDLLTFVAIFSKRVSELSGDIRSSLWVLRSLGTEIKTLAMYCKGNEIPTDNLLDSYRTFLHRNMAKNWCDDSGDKLKIAVIIKKQVEAFNGLLVDIYGETPKMPLLENKDIAPKGLDRPMQVQFYWKTITGQSLFKGIQKLNYKEGSNDKRSLAEREQKPWQSELSEYYHSLSSWKKGEGMSDVDYFHQKFALMGLLLQIAPRSNPQYLNILSDYVALLAQDRSQQENVIEWLWETRIPFIRLDHAKLSSDNILTAYLESNSSSLQVLAKAKLFIDKYKK